MILVGSCISGQQLKALNVTETIKRLVDESSYYDISNWLIALSSTETKSDNLIINFLISATQIMQIWCLSFHYMS